MNTISNRLRVLAVSAVAAVAMAGVGDANAQSASMGGATDEWRFRATLYGWFPGIDGTTEFPSGAGGPAININADELLRDLKMTFMGAFEAQYGRWGGLVDWFYADVGSTKSGTRDFSVHGQTLPVGLTANLSLDVKTNLLTLAGTYSLVESPAYSNAVVFGARMLDVDQTLNWAFNGTGPLGVARTGTSNVSATNWDGIVGIRGRASFGNQYRWFVPYYFDVGTGDSKFTWQARIGVGYSFTWGDVVAAWRYLDYDFDDGPLKTLTFNGAAVGVSFKF